MSRLLRSFVLLLFMMISLSLLARDLGSRGHLFPIEEEDLLIYLKKRVLSLSEEEREQLEEEAKRRVVKSIQEPKAVEGLREAKVYRRFFFDPSITAQEDFKDAEGKVIVARGSKVNPLDTVSLPESLLFFDGSDERQLRFAKEDVDRSTWILVKGKPLDLEEREERPVYFDQSGVLVRKFSITHIPAKVSQEGKMLKIEEFPLEEEPL